MKKKFDFKIHKTVKTDIWRPVEKSDSWSKAEDGDKGL